MTERYKKIYIYRPPNLCIYGRLPMLFSSPDTHTCKDDDISCNSTTVIGHVCYNHRERCNEKYVCPDKSDENLCGKIMLFIIIIVSARVVHQCRTPDP